MNKEKEFFKTCFNTVARLEVKNESQAIAKEVVLNEYENLQEENKQLQEKIFQLENLVDVILSSYIFENMCPLELFLEKNLKEKKARCIFYLKNDCEKNCDDDFKKCWLKYFKNLQELENETANNCNDCKKCKGIDSNE